MNTLAISIKPKLKHPKKFLIELDAEKFERLAANFGFFSADFLKSLSISERDYEAGRIKKIKSLSSISSY